MSKLSPMQQATKAIKGDMSIPPFLQRKAGLTPSYHPTDRKAPSVPDPIDRPWRRLFPEHPNDALVRESLTRQSPREERTDANAPSSRPEGAKAPRTPRGRATGERKPNDLVSVQAIADSLKVSAKDARQALRDSKTPKPAFGWAFAKSDVKAITATITKHLRKKAK